MPLFILTVSPVSAKPILKTNTVLATAGYFQLSWDDVDPNATFQLHQATDSAFRNFTILYQGTDKASLQSGLADGVYYYRVLDQYGKASNVVTVEVSHHSLSKAFAFFALGAVMFFILLGVLLSAHLNKDIR